MQETYNLLGPIRKNMITCNVQNHIKTREIQNNAKSIKLNLIDSSRSCNLLLLLYFFLDSKFFFHFFYCTFKRRIFFFHDHNFHFQAFYCGPIVLNGLDRSLVLGCTGKWIRRRLNFVVSYFNISCIHPHLDSISGEFNESGEQYRCLHNGVAEEKSFEMAVLN